MVKRCIFILFVLVFQNIIGADNAGVKNNNATVVISAPQSTAPGSTFWVDVQAGTNDNPVADLFGSSFILNFQDTQWLDVVTPHASNVVAGDFIGANPVFFADVDEAAGQVSLGVSRKSGSGGVNGFGSLARIHVSVPQNTPDGTVLDLHLSDLNFIDSNGDPIAVKSETASILVSNAPTDPDTARLTIAGPAECAKGDDIWIDIQVGSSTAPVADLFGSSFILKYQDTQWLDVVTPYASNVVAGDFIGANPVFFADVDDAAGQVSLGVSRKSGSGGVNGFGSLARIHFSVPESTPEGTIFKFHLSDVNLIDAAGAPMQIATEPYSIRVSSASTDTSSMELVVNPTVGMDTEYEMIVSVENVTELFGISFKICTIENNAFIRMTDVVYDGILGTDVLTFDSFEDNSTTASIGISRKAGQSGFSGSGELCRIRFGVTNDAPQTFNSRFEIREALGTRANGETMNFQISDCSFTVSVEKNQRMPQKIRLYANYPNPFNPVTTIRFDLTRTMNVRLDIININGKTVRNLVNSYKTAGSYSIPWDALDDKGRKVASGVYIYRLLVSCHICSVG